MPVSPCQCVLCSTVTSSQQGAKEKKNRSYCVCWVWSDSALVFPTFLTHTEAHSDRWWEGGWWCSNSPFVQKKINVFPGLSLLSGRSLISQQGSDESESTNTKMASLSTSCILWTHKSQILLVETSSSIILLISPNTEVTQTGCETMLGRKCVISS